MTRSLMLSALLLSLMAAPALAGPGGPHFHHHRGYGPPAGDMRPGRGYGPPPPMRRMGPPPPRFHRMPPPPPRYYYPPPVVVAPPPVMVAPPAPSGALNLNPLPGVELSLYW